MNRIIVFVALLLATVVCDVGIVTVAEVQGMETKKPGEPYQAADFHTILGMAGFSDTLLNNHFKLYQGYVKNTNLLLEKLNSLLKEGRTELPEYAELKRRLGFEFNGMRLHELYFGNLGGKKDLDQASPLYSALVREFGSFTQWQKDFIATGAMRGIGWAILYLDTQTGRLVNAWINEHETNHWAGCKPLLVMDVFEHAYVTDYQLDRAKYIEAFFKNINWDVVGKRYP
jgi:Fe-Mn family superoxide dismutase